MDGKITGFSPPDKFYFDLQRFDLVTERQLDQPGETIVAKVASTEQAQVNVASDEVVSPATLSDTQGADAVFSVTTASGTKYGTAADFTTENLAGATEINILGNFTLSSAAVSGLTATINVKDGAQFTVNKDITNTSGTSAINVESGGSLSVTGGTILGGSASIASVIVNGGGSFNMSGGTIKNNETGTAIDFRGTTGTISGGTIGETNDATSLNVTAGEITISGGTFSSGTTSISCSNGTVNITNSTSKFTVAVADSSNITKPSFGANVDGKYSYYNSLEDATANCVASIGEGNNIRYYTTLSNAISGAKDNETIKLLKNVTNSAQITFSASKTITLDLAGHSYGFKTITNNSGFGTGILCKNLNLTIMSSVTGAKVDFNQSKYGFYFTRSSTNYTVNIGANVEFTNISDTFIQAQGSNSTYTVNMTGSTVTAPDGIFIAQNSTGTVNMSGGTINAKTFGIVDNGNDTDKTVDINISGTAVINSEKYGIYHPHQGKVTVSGGTITGGETGIELRAGSIEVTGGTISGKATAGSYSSIANGNGTTSKGVGIAIAQHTTKKNITANISGGTISGDRAFDIANPQGNKEGEGELTVDISGGTFTGTSEAVASTDNRVSKDFVTGGVFSTDVADYIADEYKENYQYLDGKTYVGASKDKMTATAYSYYLDDKLYYFSTAPSAPTNAVAQIGENRYYTSFKNALNSDAASGATIKLLAATTYNTEISLSNDLTIDLNGNTFTDTEGITVASGGNFSVIDSTGGTNGSLEAAVTVKSGGSANVLSGKVTEKVTNNGTFNMSGGTIETTADAIENNGTLNFSGGKIRAGGIGINNSGTSTNIYGGSIFGKTGIKMLLGVLSILGGKIRGYANGIPQNANVPEDVVSPETPAADGNTSDGVAIFIAPEKTSTEGAELTVNIGDPDNKADIDIAGTAAALNVGSATGTGTAPEVEVNLNDGKLSSVSEDGSAAGSGAAISYNNAGVQLNVDGVLLENKFEIGDGISNVVGQDKTSKINIQSLAVAGDSTDTSSAVSGSAEDIKKLLTQSASIDGDSYSEVGGAVSKNIVAAVGDTNYSSLNKVIEVISADDYTGESNVTLKKSMNISEQVNVAKDISLNFGDNKLTYAGTDNAGLVVTSGTLNIDTDKGIVNSNGALGIVIKGGAKVMVKGQEFTEAAKIKTGSGDAASFRDINDAMRQLDQPGEVLVATVAKTTANVPADEPGVVTPADVTEQTVTWNTYNGSGWTGWKYGTFAQFKADAESGTYSNIQLGSDLTLESAVNSKAYILAASDITLDLNGHTLEWNGANPIILAPGANLTVDDTSAQKNGKITGTNNVIWVGNGGSATFTLNNGTIEATGIAIRANVSSTVSVNGGAVTGSTNIYNNGGNNNITVTGGTFSSDVSQYVSNQDDCKFLDGNLYVGATAQGDKFTADKIAKYTALALDDTIKYYTTPELADAAKAAAIASVGDMLYSSAQKAVDNATTGSTITLLNNVTGNITFNNGKDLTLDLNGHDVSYPTDRPITIGNQDADSVENTKLTIIGKGNITGKYGISVMGGTFAGENTKQYSTLVLGKGDGTDDIKVTATTQWAVWGNGNHNGNGGDNCGTDITINNGVTLNGGEAAGIYNPQTGKLTINGGTITGTTGVEIRAGSLNVTGGTITGTGNEYTVVNNGNGSTTDGAGIAIAQHTTKKDIALEVTGGNISGIVGLSIANPENNGNNEGDLKVDIKGGTFTGTNSGTPIASGNADDRVKVDISDGTFKGELKTATITPTAKGYKLTLDDIKDDQKVQGAYNITGGSFSYDVADYVAKGTDYQYLDGKTYVGASKDKMTATAYSLYIDDKLYYYSSAPTITEGTITVDSEEKAAVVAQIGTNKYYTSFENALKSDAASGATIKLLAATDYNTAIELSNDLTIDLNGKAFTDTEGIKVASGGNFSVIDSSADKDGTLAAAITNSGTVNVSSGKISSTVTNNGTFTMSGGSIETSDNAINNESGGTVNISGGQIKSGAIGISNRGTSTNIYGGSIFGMVGIRMLLGALGILGGKIRGYTKGAFTAAQQSNNVPEVVSPEDGADDITSEAGSAISIAQEGTTSEGKVAVTIGNEKADTKADIDIAGTKTALNIGTSSAGSADAAPSVSLYEGKLAAISNESYDEEETTTEATGSAITYADNSTAQTKLTIDGAILKNKIDVSTATNIGSADTTGEGDSAVTNSIVIKKVAINSTAANNMIKSEESATDVQKAIAEAFKSVFQMDLNDDESEKDEVATMSLDGENYGFVGSAKTKAALETAIATAVGEASVAKISSAFYTSLAEAIIAAGKESATDKAITLSRNINTANQLTLSNGISLKLNGKTFYYTGGGNAALTIAENAKVTLDTDQLLDSNGNVLGIAMASGAEVYIDGQLFNQAAYLPTGTNGVYAYFQDLNNAMKQLDQAGEVVVAKVAETTANVPADEPGVVTPAQVTNGENLKITLSGSEVELTGLAADSEVTISNDNGNNITLSKANFGTGIRVVSNAGNYKFNLVTLSGNDFETGAVKTFMGADTADTIINAIGDLTISGAGGADSIQNTGASATINGGEGNDSIQNSADNASVNGGAGDDNISNSNANATVEGGDGSDTISNGGASSSIFGGAGNDLIKNTYTPTDDDTSVVTIDGGAGSDTLVGYSTGKELFYYSVGNDSITGYGDGDSISLTGSTVSPFTDVSKFSVIDDRKFVFNFGTNNTLTVDSTVDTVTVQSGTDSAYYYTKNSAAHNTDGISLTSAYTAQNFNASIGENSVYTTVDASAVTNNSISIKGGNDANYLVASESNGGTLDGGTGNNTLVGGTGSGSADLFVHTTGANDIIYNYTYGTDIVSLAGGSAPTDPDSGVEFDSTDSKFVLNLGDNDSLTFKGTNYVQLTKDDKTYYYERNQVVVSEGTSAKLSQAFTGTSFNVNKLGDAYADVTTIDASAVTASGGLNITGNTDNPNFIIAAKYGGTVTGGDSGNTLTAASGTTEDSSLRLIGGEGDDSLVGGTSKDTFVYNGGTDSISGYATGDLVNVNSSYKLSEAEFTAEDNNISLDFGGGDALIFEGVGNTAVSVQSGNNKNYYTYAQQYFAHNKSITLAAGYSSGTPNTFNGADYSDYTTIDASAVTEGISVVGNDNNNYIIGPTAANATLHGGEGNDKINVSERDETPKYLFEYTAGKDEITGFDAAQDTVSIAVTDITAAKASNGNGKLTLTVKKNSDVLTLRGDEIEKVSLTSSDANYLTKDGYVKETTTEGETTGTLKLFASAKGQIDLTDALYAESSIKSVVADLVKSQGVTLTGGEQGGTFTYMANNKKKDGFVYGGGDVTINGYETGRDRIDLGSASLTSFASDGNNVSLNVGGNTISIVEAAGKEVLLRDGASKSSSYKKMVFADNGVLQNKEKNPTLVTISGAAADYSVSQTSIKKIFVTEVTRENFSVQAGDKNNTQIDASNAGVSVSLSGGAKNDKLIGNTVESASDLFVYSAGKDIIQNFSAGDSISITSGLSESLGSARITAGSNSIKFRFTNKDTLTIKSNTGKTLNNTLNINGEEKTYAKNAIESGGQVTLTSAYSGTFKTDDKKLATAATTVNGAAVSKNLTFKGTTEAESLTGGTKKTTFKGGGGADTLVGGSGKDIFVYTKNETGTTTIADFEFGSGRAGNDKLKIASGTISEISTVTADSKTAIQFAMNTGKNTANVGWFNVEKGSKDIAIKANNTYYWFAKEDGEDVNGNAVAIGQLITSDSKISNSDVSSLDIIDLNYSTNLVKAGVAVKVSGAKPTT